MPIYIAREFQYLPAPPLWSEYWELRYMFLRCDAVEYNDRGFVSRRTDFYFPLLFLTQIRRYDVRKKRF